MYHKTPLFQSFKWSKHLNKTVYYKMDCFQPSGSFKIRGISRLCQQKQQEGIKQFVIASGGNAGLAVAYAGYLMKIPVTVVVPESTKSNVRKRIQHLGATLEVVGTNWDAAHKYTLKLANDENIYYIHPFDHPTLWAGHASIVHELAEDLSSAPDLIILSVGGGGLFTGVMQGLAEVGWQRTKILTSETFGAASLAKSLEAGKLISLSTIDTIATSLGARQIAHQAWDFAQYPQVQATMVSDQACLYAMRLFLEEYKILVEPACGAALAALYQEKLHQSILQAKSIVTIVCGGSGGNLADLLFTAGDD